MEFVCIKTCSWNHRKYKVGETIVADKAPLRHFVEKGSRTAAASFLKDQEVKVQRGKPPFAPAKSSVRDERPQEEPRTLSELAEQQAELTNHTQQAGRSGAAPADPSGPSESDLEKVLG